MHDTGLWHFLRDRLRAGERACLAVVVEGRGGVPGRTGFKMAAAPGNRFRGTVGGGSIEHEMIEEARDMLAGGASGPRLYRRTLRGEQGTGAESMVCGGRMTVAVLPLGDGDIPAVEAVLAALRDDLPVGLDVSAAGMAVLEGSGVPDEPVFTEGDEWRYREALGCRGTVYVVGGGHVGLALCRALRPLDMRIVVIDERPDVHTMQDNEYADRKVVAPFDDVAPHIREGAESYAIVATPGHRADETVLRQLVRKPLRYLGVMGSKTKVRVIMGRLLDDGFTEDELARVHAPIGLPIHSHTPAEIAVSIAAEIIAVRNG